jgi:hypothetical protein
MLILIAIVSYLDLAALQEVVHSIGNYNYYDSIFKQFKILDKRST